MNKDELKIQIALGTLKVYRVKVYIDNEFDEMDDPRDYPDEWYRPIEEFYVISPHSSRVTESIIRTRPNFNYIFAPRMDVIETLNYPLDIVDYADDDVIILEP